MKPLAHKNIEIASGVLVINPKGEILFTTGPKWRGFYTIVGGHFEYGESIENGVRRELQEEIGVVPKRIEFLSVGEAIEPSWFHRPAHFIFLNFVAWIDDEHALLLSKEEFTGQYYQYQGTNS